MPFNRIVFYVTVIALALVLSAFGVAVLVPEKLTGAYNQGFNPNVLFVLIVLSLAWVAWYVNARFLHPLEEVTRAIEEASTGGHAFELDPTLTKGSRKVARLAKSAQRLKVSAKLAQAPKKFKEFSFEKNSNEVLKL